MHADGVAGVHINDAVGWSSPATAVGPLGRDPTVVRVRRSHRTWERLNGIAATCAML